MCTLSTYHRHNVCAVARNGKASGRCGIDRHTMTVYGVGAGVSEGTDGEAASAKLKTLTHAYYAGILKVYTPAIYHGQDLGRGDRCGLRLKARVRKVKKVTPPCT